MTKEELINELGDPDINEFTNRIEILNDEQLIYHKKYPIDKKSSKRKIEFTRLIALYDLKAFEMTRNELIEFGIDELQLEKYYKFENLIIGVY